MGAPRTTCSVVRSVQEYLLWRKANVTSGRTSIGLVSTKGAIHEGHLHLARRARHECDLVVVTAGAFRQQFSSDEAFEAFPRTPDEDIERVRQSQLASVIFVIDAAELCPFGPVLGAKVSLESPLLTAPYCDLAVAQGECTILVKTLNVIRPHRLYVGERDIMRCRMFVRVISDLHLAIDVVSLPTIRDGDGVAYNGRLSGLPALSVARVQTIYSALQAVIAAYLKDVFTVQSLVECGLCVLRGNASLAINYLRIGHPYGLHDISVVDPDIGAIVFVSVSLEKTCLTDNVILAPMTPSRERTLWGLFRAVHGQSESPPPSQMPTDEDENDDDDDEESS